MLRRGEDEIFGGGAAGGGKSEVEVVAPLAQVHIPHFRGLVLRKTYKELEELLGKAERYYPRAFPRARFNGSKYTWTFPSGAKIEFGNLEHTKDKYKYQGRAFDFIGFDELTHFFICGIEIKSRIVFYRDFYYVIAVLGFVVVPLTYKVFLVNLDYIGRRHQTKRVYPRVYRKSLVMREIDKLF